MVWLWDHSPCKSSGPVSPRRILPCGPRVSGPLSSSFSRRRGLVVMVGTVTVGRWYFAVFVVCLVFGTKREWELFVEWGGL